MSVGAWSLPSSCNHVLSLVEFSPLFPPKTFTSRSRHVSDIILYQSGSPHIALHNSFVYYTQYPSCDKFTLSL
jgi:hypothetical protein